MSFWQHGGLFHLLLPEPPSITWPSSLVQWHRATVTLLWKLRRLSSFEKTSITHVRDSRLHFSHAGGSQRQNSIPRVNQNLMKCPLFFSRVRPQRCCSRSTAASLRLGTRRREHASSWLVWRMTRSALEVVKLPVFPSGAELPSEAVPTSGVQGKHCAQAQ